MIGWWYEEAYIFINCVNWHYLVKCARFQIWNNGRNELEFYHK